MTLPVKVRAAWIEGQVVSVFTVYKMVSILSILLLHNIVLTGIDRDIYYDKS